MCQPDLGFLRFLSTPLLPPHNHKANGYLVTASNILLVEWWKKSYPWVKTRLFYNDNKNKVETIRNHIFTVSGTIGTIGITNGANCITSGTIGRTLNDIGIPLVPLVEP